MKTIACIYCEGNDTKLAVIAQEKGESRLKVLSTASVDVVGNKTELKPTAGFNLEGEGLQLEGVDAESSATSDVDAPSIGALGAALNGINLNSLEFVPALTEPAIYYHPFDGKKDLKGAKLVEAILSDIRLSKSVNVDKENMDFIELADGSLLSAFIDGPVACVNLVNNIAGFFGKKFFKVPTIKSSDIALAYYVAKRKKFFPDDQSLVVYIGKEYSKLIFLQGRKLKHIGSTLDIGTTNLHTYDVYFSKILLEMENGGITSLDNIIVCGEDDSENLILSFYGTFPEANVSRLEFDDLDLSQLNDEAKAKFSSFSVPIATATEFFDELAKEHKGINILPKYISEEQKFFQFSWHSFAVLPLLFIAAFLLTLKMLQNGKELSSLDNDIKQKNIIIRQNQETLSKISELEGKISSFGQTQAILDSAAVGTGVWKNVLKDVSGFCGSKQNIWISKLARENSNSVVIEGYSLSKYSPTDLAYSLETARLNSMMNEALREKNAYKYNLTFDITSYQKKK
ncbi:MAG TPA: hypothetical protein PKD67_09770 [Ignavibacteriaceae bacterium]|nr:hypothetical protein [Ignavibacteriaceae bacterium]